MRLDANFKTPEGLLDRIKARVLCNIRRKPPKTIDRLTEKSILCFALTCVFSEAVPVVILEGKISTRQNPWPSEYRIS